MAVYFVGGLSSTQPVNAEVEAMVAAVRSTLETAKRAGYDAFIPVNYRRQVAVQTFWAS